MNRLTKKRNGEVIIPTYRKFLYGEEEIGISTIVLLKAYEKLSKLEDIEDQLGCPLEVIFKAIKNGIFIKRKCFDKVKFIFVPVVLDDYGLGEISNGEIMDYFCLKDYKVTWWLKEDVAE